MNQMGITALLTMIIIVIISQLEGKGKADAKGIVFNSGLFKTSSTFNIGSFAIMLVVAALYAYFW